MAVIDGIEVVGCPRFEYRTRQALELLCGSNTFAFVKPFLGAVREARTSGLLVIRDKTVFQVGRPTWQARLEWYASAIVHDAGHAKLYRENRRRFLGIRYTPRNSWTGAEAERTCLRLQLAALIELHAGRELLRYLTLLIERPTYQDKWLRTW